MKIKIKRKHKGVVLPTYATSGSAGFDLSIDSFIKKFRKSTKVDPITDEESVSFQEKDRTISIEPGQRILIGTGLYMEIAEGYEVQIRPRSGNALKLGLTVLNSPGTIDSDYRGEVGVILINQGLTPITLSKGMKIAQGVLAKVEQAEFEEIEVLSDTDRGFGGYGSTGK